MLTEYTDYAKGPNIISALKNPDNTIRSWPNINNHKLLQQKNS